jgi:hypothetical protein
MATLVGSTEGGLRLGPMVNFHEHCAEIKRSNRVTASIRAAVGGFGAGKIAAPFEDHAEARRGRGLCELGMAIGGLGIAIGGLGMAIRGLGIAIGGLGMAIRGLGIAIGGLGGGF